MITKHIIDHKAVSLTDDEWNTYNSICASYDEPPSQNGKDLFRDLFEVNGDGIIIFLKPPKRLTSFEILFFLMNLMTQQHLRLIHQQVDRACERVDEKLKELDSKKKSKSKT